VGIRTHDLSDCGTYIRRTSKQSIHGSLRKSCLPQMLRQGLDTRQEGPTTSRGKTRHSADKSWLDARSCPSRRRRNGSAFTCTSHNCRHHLTQQAMRRLQTPARRPRVGRIGDVGNAPLHCTWQRSDEPCSSCCSLRLHVFKGLSEW
jgi:hypothetical protein